MNTPLFLLRDTPEDLWALSVRNPDAHTQLEKLVAPGSESKPSVPLLRVLIAYVDQLHNYVQEIPPLAWELLEYADEPLEIVYPQKKFSVQTENESSAICVRLVKQPKLLRFLQKQGPVWAARWEDGNFENISVATPVDCRDKKYPYQYVKTVMIRRDGTFTFLR